MVAGKPLMAVVVPGTERLDDLRPPNSERCDNSGLDRSNLGRPSTLDTISKPAILCYRYIVGEIRIPYLANVFAMWVLKTRGSLGLVSTF